MLLQGKQLPNVHLRVNTGTRTLKELTTALFVATGFSGRTLSLQVLAVGPAFLSLLVKTVLFTVLIILWVWNVQK
jgi:hypothetical protein